MDIGTFYVQRVILHEIPKVNIADKGAHLPELADLETELDDTRRRYFQQRIRRSLQNGYAAERDPDEPSPVPGLLLEHFTAKPAIDDFVRISRDIAVHLHHSQGGSSPKGLIAVIEGTVTSGKDAGKCIAILKLEMEPGVHIEAQTVDGKVMYAVTLEDVTLTETTRVFKASLFPRFSNLGAMEGVVSDDQLDSSTVGREIAEYFLHGFLGCRIKMTPSIATKRFMEEANNFVNTLGDDDKKLRYETAVRAELESATPTLSPETIATKYFDAEDRDTFVARFRGDDNTVPTFPKDLDLVRSAMKRTWVELDNGVRVTGPPEAVQQTVHAIQSSESLKATIKKVR